VPRIQQEGRASRHPAQFDDVLENYIRWRQQFLDDHGELQPRFQPAADGRVFHARRTRFNQREHIPVPKGPVEVW
jgi:tRNA-dihydrouridine synthase B